MKDKSQRQFKLLSVLLFLLSLSYSSFAQQALFQEAERFSSDSLNSHIQNTSVSISWVDTSALFTYRLEKGNEIHYYLGDAARGKKELLFTSAEMGAHLSEIKKDIKLDDRWLIYQLEVDPKETHLIRFNYSGANYQFNRKTGSLSEVKKDESKKQAAKPSFFASTKAPYWQKFSSDSTYYIYGLNHNLYLNKKGEDKPFALTNDGEKFYSYVTSSNTDNEDKMSPMVYWMENSSKFVGLREDSRKVEEMSVINSLTQPRPKTITYKFPMPGDTAVSQYSLYVFDAQKKTATELDISKYKDQRIIMQSSLVNGKTYVYAGNIGSDEQYVYFLRRNRTNDKIDLCRLDTEREIVEELISEETKPHFNEQLFTVRILNGGEDILWWSERTGFGTYYLYDKAGKQKSQLGNGKFVSGNILKIDTANRQ